MKKIYPVIVALVLTAFVCAVLCPAALAADVDTLYPLHDLPPVPPEWNEAHKISLEEAQALFAEMNAAAADQEAGEPLRVAAAQEYRRGDVDGNEKVNSADARLVLRAAARLVELTPEQFERADLNGDGRVNSADARALLQLAARIA